MRNTNSSSARNHVVLLVLLLTLVASSAGQANIQGQWSTLSTPMPINPVHVALLYNGKVLIVSGSGNVAGNTNYQAAVWDPQTNTINTQPVTWDMFCNGMVVLPDGRPFINGGTLQYDPFHGQPRSAVFDPATNTFRTLVSKVSGSRAGRPSLSMRSPSCSKREGSAR